MPLFGLTSVRSLWPTGTVTVTATTEGDDDEPNPEKTAREASCSRVNEKSPHLTPPSKGGTTPLSAADCQASERTPTTTGTTASGPIKGLLRMNSWGRSAGGGGVGGVGLSRGGKPQHHKSRSLRPNRKKKSMEGKNTTMDVRFQDPGTASTLSMMTPSEADLSSSSSFFVRSHRSSSFRHSSSSPPSSPSLMSSTPERPWGVVQRDNPLHEEVVAEDAGDDVDRLQVEGLRPVMIDENEEDESESSSHSTLCLAPPPSSSSSAPPLVDESSSGSYELTRNDKRELGFLHCQATTVSEAMEIAQRVRKPVLCYRLPSHSGMATARALEVAAEVWSHPLLVEAAQSLFVTVCCGPSEDEEPNTPPSLSLDVLNSSGVLLVPTLVSSSSSSTSSCSSTPSADSDASINRRTVTRAMVKALERYHPQRSVPRYLLLLHEEEEAGHGELAVLGTADPVLAEIEMAGLAGVIATRSGSVDPKQRVVEVTYDPRRLSFGCVARFALKRKVANVVYHRTNDERVSAHVEIERLRDMAVTKPFAGSIQPDFDPKPALRKTPLRFVPLTSLQATRANRLVHLGRFNEAVHLLSPKQGLILMRTMHTSAQKDLHDVIEVPILPAWISVCDKRHPRYAVEQVCSCDDPTCDFENPPSYYEYNSYSTARLPPGYPWRGF